MIGCGKKDLIIMTFMIIFNVIIIKTDLFDYNWVGVFCDTGFADISANEQEALPKSERVPFSQGFTICTCNWHIFKGCVEHARSYKA